MLVFFFFCSGWEFFIGIDNVSAALHPSRHDCFGGNFTRLYRRFASIEEGPKCRTVNELAGFKYRMGPEGTARIQKMAQGFGPRFGSGSGCDGEM